MNVFESDLRRICWVRGSGGAWYFSFDGGPGEVTHTHIHLGGNNRRGSVDVKFIAFKVDDRHRAQFFRDPGPVDRGALGSLDAAVAAAFRRALNGIGIV